jgi:hypothetical protein
MILNDPERLPTAAYKAHLYALSTLLRDTMKGLSKPGAFPARSGTVAHARDLAVQLAWTLGAITAEDAKARHGVTLWSEALHVGLLDRELWERGAAMDDGPMLGLRADRIRCIVFTPDPLRPVGAAGVAARRACKVEGDLERREGTEQGSESAGLALELVSCHDGFQENARTTVLHPRHARNGAGFGIVPTSQQ